MKIVQTTGLILFLLGFTLFNTSLFLSQYRLTPQIITTHLDRQERAAALHLASQDMYNHIFPSSFSFVPTLKHAIQIANDYLISKYRLSTADIDRILRANQQSFHVKSISSLFSDSSKVNTFKRKVLTEHLQSFHEKKIQRSDLVSIAQNIEKYMIPQNIGFDSYHTKDLVFALTKASEKGPVNKYPLIFLLITIGFCALGGLAYHLPKASSMPGIKNNGIFFSSIKNRGWLGIAIGTWLILFYIALYFYPEYLTNWVNMVDPVSEILKGKEAGRFFLYGFMYTLCILVMGIRMIIHYQHSKYHVIRTFSVMFFQTCFAFLIPEFLLRLNQPYFDFKNIWPLDYDFFFGYEINNLITHGSLGIFMLGWGIALIIVAVPMLVYFYGKRWYCSWVCGCGGLAETLGDPYRHLSNKSVKAWQIERWLVHSVLLFAVVMTAAVLYTYWTGNSWFIFVDSYTLRSVYGSFIGAGFAGVVGTGFYPLMGNRVWCRFGCPLAAYLGIIQRFKSRFRITTNGGQCISCGNCSTYCEMGIDVRWYAQRGQNIVRSSCVGCGVCSSVCPRGVLNLETRDEQGRFGKPILIGNNNIEIVE